MSPNGTCCDTADILLDVTQQGQLSGMHCLVCIREELLIELQALASPWLPRVDGKFLKEDPQKLVLKGRYASSLLIHEYDP